MNKALFSLKVLKGDETIKHISTRSKRRFINFTRTINWSERDLKVYLKVTYGKDICVRGCACLFYNDAHLDNKQEFQETLKAFLE